MRAVDRAGALVGLMAAVALGGCGSTAAGQHRPRAAKAPSPVAKLPSKSAPAHRKPSSREPSMVAFAKCMRAHGVANFPDPTQRAPIAPHGAQPAPAGGFTANPDSPGYLRASQDCKSLAVATPVSQTQSAEMMAAQLRFSTCMRSHGVPNYPDPTSTGEIGRNGAIPGVDESAPAFEAAERKCQRLLPRPPDLTARG
jgi:hypothetical protein